MIPAVGVTAGLRSPRRPLTGGATASAGGMAGTAIQAALPREDSTSPKVVKLNLANGVSTFNRKFRLNKNSYNSIFDSKILYGATSVPRHWLLPVRALFDFYGHFVVILLLVWSPMYELLIHRESHFFDG